MRIRITPIIATLGNMTTTSMATAMASTPGRSNTAISTARRGWPRRIRPASPPGQARKIVRDYGLGVGQILPRDRYIRISDPYRYDLEPRPGWDYYRGDDAIYRVDSSTRKILAVLNLISAFSN